MEKRKSMEWEQKSLSNELTQGKDLAEQLMSHLHHSSSQETKDFLISKILFSYDKALSLLTGSGDGSDGESKHIPAHESMLESPTSFGNSSPLSEISDQDCKDKNVFKKRKTMPRCTKEVKVSSGTGLDGSLDDGYSWRKYGQKDILVSRDDSLSLPPVRHLDLNTSMNKLSKPSKPRFPGSNHKES